MGTLFLINRVILNIFYTEIFILLFFTNFDKKQQISFNVFSMIYFFIDVCCNAELIYMLWYIDLLSIFFIYIL